MLMATSLTHARPLTTVAATSASFYPSRLVPQPPDLIKWVRREGGFVHQSIKIAQLEEGSNGLGLVAAENIPKGSDLISLPRHIPLKFEAADAEDGAHSTLVNLARNVPDRSNSRSPVRSCSPRRGRNKSSSFSRSRSYSWLRSLPRRGKIVEYEERRSRSPGTSRSPLLKSGSPPSKTWKRSPTPDGDSPRERGSPPRIREEIMSEQNRYNQSPKESSQSPTSPERESPAYRRYDESPYGTNGDKRIHTPREDGSPVDEDDSVPSNQGSESP